jgi:arginyl-tRNA synthetase
MIKDQITKLLQKITGIKEINLEFPDNPEFGDYSSNIAMEMSSKSQFPRSKSQTNSKIPNSKFKNPRELAEYIVSKILINKSTNQPFDRVEVAGPGFINFWLKKDVLVNNLIQIDALKDKYGASSSLKGKKIVLEFTDPNPFKEFHIGHVYTNTVGESLSRLFESVGAEVRRVNYQGDIGLHVAKAIWGMMDKMKHEKVTIGGLSKKPLTERIKFMGEAYALGSSVYEEEASTKEEINILNKKIYKEDPEIKDLYKTGRKWSLEYFDTIYKRLGTKFNNYYFESEVEKLGQKIVEENLKKGIFEKSQGAIIFPGKKYGLHDRVFINSLGIPTYEAKELGLAPTKYKDFAYDQSIIITANEINEYFKVLIKAMSLIYPELGEKTLHIGHGMIRLPEGKMSSRTGKVITGASLLDEVKAGAAKINEESSEMVAIAAVKYAFLKVGIGKDIVYDIKESLSLEGNSGPYLQYTVARSNSVMQKASTFKGEPLQGDYSDLNEEELLVLRCLIKFPEIIETAAKSYSPNLLCNYLYELASKYNTFYNKYRIISEEGKTKSEKVENFRLALTAGTGQVLKNGLKILGIQAPERM